MSVFRPNGWNTYAAYYVMHGGVDPSGLSTKQDIEKKLKQVVDDLKKKFPKWKSASACGRDLTVEIKTYERDPNELNCIGMGNQLLSCLKQVSGGELDQQLAPQIYTIIKMCADAFENECTLIQNVSTEDY